MSCRDHCALDILQPPVVLLLDKLGRSSIKLPEPPGSDQLGQADSDWLQL